MVSKKEILETVEELSNYFDDLNHEMVDLSIRFNKLEKKVTKLGVKKCSCQTAECKLDKAVESCKAKKAKRQPRDKSGKFTKKK